MKQVHIRTSLLLPGGGGGGSVFGCTVVSISVSTRLLASCHFSDQVKYVGRTSFFNEKFTTQQVH